MATDRFDTGRCMISGMTPFERPGSDIKRMGYLKKLKTNKKKFFVLRSTSSSGPARMEYYDSEKKFKHGQLPKRSIQLHTLLNINKKWDSKHKYAIALYTKDDCFSVLAEDEAEQEEWYTLLLEYQCEYLREDDNRREHFEHVWQVTIQQKGLAMDKRSGGKLRGNFRLCLSSQSLSLFRVNSEKPQISFQLATVRSLAHNDNLFRMEVGSWAPTGAGELWMHVEDSVIAQSMHEAILNCMKAITSSGSIDEADSARFEKRAGTVTAREYPSRTDFRPRTVSESHTQSPRRMRPKPMEEPPRPVSIVYPSSRSTSLPADVISPGTSPHMHIELLHGHRFRSDSAESRASRSSMLASANDDLSPMEFPIGPPYSDHSSHVIDEEDNDYLDQEIGSHDYQSVSSSPGEAKTPLEEDSSNTSPYIDMQPTNTTPPMARSGGAGGYVDMRIGAQAASHEVSESDAYMSMNTGRMVSEPIPIKAGSNSGGGYMDMSHSSHLPTVREGGSNEGYLPMTPNSGQSSYDASHLRPEPAVCMLSEDSEIHRRTYSLGSRPPTKTSSRISSIHDPVPIKRGGIMDSDGRSSSAPHLITNRGRSLNVESPTPSASPLSMSYKSESSYRSDDSDSFMELDFHRPRTASDSHGYRPRASSFGKTAIQTLQGHRPRSSSYGQGVRTFKLRHGARIASHESVRTTSQELLHKSSIDSLSHRSSKDSLRVSSSESLRKLSEELRTKTNLLNTDYIDMSMEKRKTPSPQPPNRGRENGYMDMTLGSRTTSPSRSKSSHDSGNTSKSQSSEMLHVQGHLEQTYINVDTPEMTSSTSSGPNYINVDQGHADQGLHTRQSQGRPESRGSEKHPKPVAEDMYVMYEPSSKGSGSGHTREEGHQAVTMRKGSGSTDSLKKKSRQSGSGEKSKSREHRHKGSSSSKRKSQVEESKDVHVTKVLPMSHTRKRESNVPPDEYIEFAPVGKSSGSGAASSGPGSKFDMSSSEPVLVESEYVGYQPRAVSAGTALSKPQAVKSFFSSESKREKGTSKSASASSRVTSESGLTSSKSEKAPESEYVLSSPIRGSTPGFKSGGDASDYVLSSPIEGPVSGSKPRVQSDTSDYVLSSPMSDTASKPNVSGAGDASDYVLSSPMSNTASKPKASGAGDASDYVLSSPIGSSTPLSSKGAGQSSDYVMASPAELITQYTGAREKKEATVSLAGSTAGQKKSSNIVPQSADSAFYKVGPSRETIGPSRESVGPSRETVGPLRETVGGHEGTSVDPPVQSDTAKCPSQEVSRPVECSSSDSSVSGKPKPQSKVENVKSPGGSRKDKKSGRTKHYSGNSGSGSSTFRTTGLTGESESEGQGGGESGQFLEEPGSAALTRPGSTPCMLSLDETKAKPVPAGTTLKVDATTRGRHSISDLSAYEQMTFPSNTLSSSQQQSSSSTLSSQQQVSSTGSEKVLNYASLDLGSSETVGEGDGSLRSPRIKSRHSSAADEKGEPPLSYAQIDFEKSENLKSASGNKDVKFTL